MPDTQLRDAYDSLCESSTFGIPGPAARLPGFAFARGLTPRAMQDARLILDVKRRGHSWRQHLVAPVADALAAAHELEAQRQRADVESVALSLEARDALGHCVRHRLYRASRADAPIEPAMLAGLTRQEWDVIVGSWLDQAAEADGLEAGPEEDDEIDFDRFPYRALVGASEMRVATIALTIPVALLIGFLGFKLNLFLGEAEAASGTSRKAPLELAEQTLPPRLPR